MHWLTIGFLICLSHQLLAENVEFIGSSDISSSRNRANREIHGLIMTGKHRDDDFKYEGSGQSDEEGSGDNEDDNKDDRNTKSPITTEKIITVPAIQIDKGNEDFYLENDTLIADHVSIGNKTSANNTTSISTSNGEGILVGNIDIQSFASDKEIASRNSETSLHTNTASPANIDNKSDIGMFNELNVNANAHTENHTSTNDLIPDDGTIRNGKQIHPINISSTDNNTNGKVSSGNEKFCSGHFTIPLLLLRFVYYIKTN